MFGMVYTTVTNLKSRNSITIIKLGVKRYFIKLAEDFSDNVAIFWDEGIFLPHF